jgi:hypothetical protein
MSTGTALNTLLLKHLLTLRGHLGKPAEYNTYEANIMLTELKRTLSGANEHLLRPTQQLVGPKNLLRLTEYLVRATEHIDQLVTYEINGILMRPM